MGLVVMFWGVTNLSMCIGVVPDVNIHGVKSRAVGRGIDSGGRGFPMDCVCPIKDLIGCGEDGL